MAFKVTTSWHNSNPDTIYNKLATKLGRQPTNQEVKAELNRIISEVQIDMAGKGKLKFQR